MPKTNEDKLLTLLGFAKKSGKVVSGDSTVRALLERNMVSLLVITQDVSEKTQMKWIERAKEKQVPYIIASEKTALGLALGQSPRSIAALTDIQFATAIKKIGWNNMDK